MKKRILAFLMTVLLVICTINLIPIISLGVSLTDWTVLNGGQVSGNGNDGFSVQVPFQFPNYRFAFLKCTENFLEKKMTFKTPEILNSSESSNVEDNNEWIQLSITKDEVTGINDLRSNTIKKRCSS